jgi:FtsZ-binding cell division protein ZapB
MKILEVLEDRVSKLMSKMIDLSEKNSLLKHTVEGLKNENEILKAENTKFAEDNAQISIQLKSLEGTLEKESKHKTDLTEEQSLAKLVVDDLIKSIDALIARENEQ